MKITIAIPIYGVERYIERCARCLFEQTYEDIDYIFVDDCSPDGSMDVLERVLADYPERKECVRIVRHDHNRGLSAARNTAVAYCKTDWIMHVDSDDWIEPNTVELLVNKQMETGADIVTGKALRHTQEDDIELVVSDKDDKTLFVLENLGYDFCHTLWNRLIQISLYEDGIIRAEEGTNLGEDWQVMSRLAWNARLVAHLDVVTYHYNCTNAGSYVYGKNSFNRKLFEQDYRSWEIVNNFYKDKDEVYRNKLFESGEKLLYRYLNLAVEGRDRKAFKDVKNKLQRHSPHFFSHGRLGRGRLKSFVESHYGLLRLSLPLRKMLVRLYSIARY